MRAALATPLFFCAALASPLFGQGDVERSLVNLRGVFVLIENLPEVAEKAGLLKAQLQTDVELRLRQSGVRVLTTEERRRGTVPGQPTLYINVNALEISPGFYAYSAQEELDQGVRLDRAPSVYQPGVGTWSAPGFLGASSGDNFAERVRQKVRDMTDQFINAYLAANPKR